MRLSSLGSEKVNEICKQLSLNDEHSGYLGLSYMPYVDNSIQTPYFDDSHSSIEESED